MASSMDPFSARSVRETEPSRRAAARPERVRLGGPHAVEVDAAHALQLGVGDQPKRRLDPVLELGGRRDPGLQHHLGRHERGGVERGHGHAGALELLREVVREHDLRELALAVGLDARVAPLQHHVVEVDRGLAGRADVDDPGGRRAAEQREEAADEQVPREVVDGEAELVAVHARRRGGPGRSRRSRSPRSRRGRRAGPSPPRRGRRAPAPRRARRGRRAGSGRRRRPGRRAPPPSRRRASRRGRGRARTSRPPRARPPARGRARSSRR